MTTTIRPKKRLDEPVTDHGLAQAIERGKARRARHRQVQATEVIYLAEKKSLHIGFADNTALLLPIDAYAELADLADAELGCVELCFAGTALCLEGHDLHVSIAGLISANPVFMQLASKVVAIQNGRQRSLAKARAARTNGLKGGRPRTLVGVD